MARNKQKRSIRNKEMPDSLNKKSESFKKTYNNVENVFMRAFRFVSDWIDRVLFNDKYSKVIAVCLALILFVIVNGGEDANIFTNTMKSAVDLDGVQVVTNISDSTYEVIDLPETVDVTVTGDTSDVQYAAQQKGNYKVLANLSDLGEGTHKVELEPLNFSNKVDVVVKPSVAVVTVKKKVSRSFNLGYDFINTNKIDKIYTLSTPTFEQNDVIVRASEDRMNEIAYVKALIDVEGKKANFEQEVEIVAYSQSGDKLDVDILPSKVSVYVEVASSNKQVPIDIEFTGELPEDIAIDAYTLDNEKVTLYAAQDVLDDIESIKVSVPLTNITSDTKSKSVTVPIVLPSGTAVKEDSITVKIDVTFDEVQTKTISNVSVNFINWQNGLSLSSDKPRVKVTLKGTKSTLKNITSSDIKVVADMKEYLSSGTKDLPLTIMNKQNIIEYELSEQTIQVEIK